MKAGSSHFQELVIDRGDPSFFKAFEVEPLSLDLRSEADSEEDRLPDFGDYHEETEEIDLDLLSPEINLDPTVLKRKREGRAEWLNWGQEFDLDPLLAEEESELETTMGSHSRLDGFSALFASALIHASLFSRLAFFRLPNMRALPVTTAI